MFLFMSHKVHFFFLSLLQRCIMWLNLIHCIFACAPSDNDNESVKWPESYMRSINGIVSRQCQNWVPTCIRFKWIRANKCTKATINIKMPQWSMHECECLCADGGFMVKSFICVFFGCESKWIDESFGPVCK